MNRKLTVLVVLGLVQIATLFSQSSETLPTLDDILKNMEASKKTALMEEGEIVVFHDDQMVPEVLPESGFTKPVKQEMIDGGLNLGMEGLYLITDLSDKYRNTPAAERTLKIHNIVRSVRTFKGLEYYSQTSKKMKTLFLESWAVDNFESKNKIPDSVVSEVPTFDSISIHQKDNRFSKNLYTMDLRNEEHNISVGIVNHTPLKVSGIFKVVDAEDMQIHIVILPYEDGMAIYVTMAAATDTKSFRKKAQQSFANRAIALKGWFEQRIQEEF